MRQHAPGCLLHDQEAPEGGDGNRLPDGLGFSSASGPWARALAL
jgi:hypothetical protein